MVASRHGVDGMVAEGRRSRAGAARDRHPGAADARGQAVRRRRPSGNRAGAGAGASPPRHARGHHPDQHPFGGSGRLPRRHAALPAAPRSARSSARGSTNTTPRSGSCRSRRRRNSSGLGRRRHRLPAPASGHVPAPARRRRGSRRALGPGYRSTNWIDLNRNLFAWMRIEKAVMFTILVLIVDRGRGEHRLEPGDAGAGEAAGHRGS